MTNDFGVVLDRSGYAPSLMQEDTGCCYACGRRSGKLDRHEPFGGAYRDKSKALGLWITLCHYPCHQGREGAHGNPKVNAVYRREAQRSAMAAYGWTRKGFVREFGKNYCDED